MSFIEGIILGLIQGLTEFIPVSSSAHLILVRDLLNIDSTNALSVDAVFQLATILAVLFYFFKDFMALLSNKTLLRAILVGTVPALILGLMLEDYMDTVFRSSHLVAITMIFGSVLMFVAERYAKQDKELTVSRGLVVGFFQALALIPGVSRSGATISGGLLSGLTRESAARFSFLLSFPIIFGAGLKKFFDLQQSGELSTIGLPLWVGSLVAFVVGLWAINFLIKYLKNNKLTIFIYYRLIIATIILFFS